jgi:hypothetical protein
VVKIKPPFCVGIARLPYMHNIDLLLPLSKWLDTRV